MEINQNYCQEVAVTTELKMASVIATLSLLFAEECTVPFISRYRKEKTGGLDEVQIQKIKDTYEEIDAREKRRVFILETLDKSKLLTDQLKKDILKAESLQVLEDIYAPYKSKRKTKGMLAKEAGLEPFAIKLKTQSLTPEQLAKEADSFINKEKEYETGEKVIQGALAIIIEEFAHNIEAKKKLRDDFWRDATLKSSVKKDADTIKDYDKFKDYFDFEQPLKQLTDEKNTHRFLAMRRGMTLKILKIEVGYPEEAAVRTLAAHAHPDGGGTNEIIESALKKAYMNYIHPSLDLEIKSELKKIADEAAINVFGVNLKNLLLQPFLGPKNVMGIDPGIRTGCKIVVVEGTGKLLLDTVIYPHEPRNEVKKSAEIVSMLVEKCDISHIAVGNGTFGRETLQFLKQNVPAVRDGKCQATLINESGASIYSASDVAREEFPDKDVTVRGAVSIARRFQDPLAELVKIDPKSIGVGQYQHDVNQSKLKSSLQSVVESCVNFVGVDVNTASKQLLSHVSGIGPSIAANVVKHREKNGLYTAKEDLIKVPRFSDKVFQQAAGFLRIKNAGNPLDNTSVHPEQYAQISNWVEKKNKNIKALFEDDDLLEQFKKDKEIRELMGDYTHDDVSESLARPGHDPRESFSGTSFREDASDIKSIKINEWYPGVVTNITKFGAFVDIGIKENGLLHISQMSDQFVSDPFTVLKVGEEVKVKVIEIDLERGRISLSRKAAESGRPVVKKESNQKGKNMPPPKSPFAALKDFKVK